MPKIYSRESSAKRGYGYKWQQARKGFLRNHPWCIRCKKIASVVDHITPHRGDMKIFWDRTNWQPLCNNCHNSYKRRLETSGTIAGCNKAGIPLDPTHHWNK